MAVPAQAAVKMAAPVEKTAEDPAVRTVVPAEKMVDPAQVAVKTAAPVAEKAAPDNLSSRG